MKITSNRFVIITVFLLVCQMSISQLSFYYQNGEPKTKAMLSDKSSAMYITQMTYYNFEFVRDRVHNCLTDVLPFTPFQDYKTVSQGGFEIISRMYKNEFNDDLAPDRRFIQVEYKTVVVEGERFIVSARFNGLPDYIGEFYGGFWMPTIDAKNVTSGEIMSTNFLQDYVSVQTKYDVNKRDQLVWIEVTNKEVKDLAKFKSELATKIKADRKAKEEFNKRRAGTVLELKVVSADEYTKLKNAVEGGLNNGLSEMKEDYTLDFRVDVSVDTTGKVTTIFSKETPLNERIQRSISNAYFSKYKENGLIMFTKDSFVFSGSKRTEKGQVFVKNEQIQIKSEHSKDFENKVNESKDRFNRGRGNYDVTVMSTDINGVKSAILNIDSFKEKKSPSYYILGGAAVLGVGGYYVYKTFFVQ
jgi:hypothetical protein